MKKRIYITIGVAGVGKSTYIKDHINERTLWVSSDNIREELFGTLDCQNKASHKKVFNEMFNRTVEALNSDKYDTVYYDATNLIRKRRTHLYNNLKNKVKDVEIVALHFIKPLNVIKDQNNQREGLKRVPEEVIDRMYRTLEVARVSVDCDRIEKAFNNDFDCLDYSLEFRYDLPHNSKYHKETIYTHIALCVANAEKVDLPHREKAMLVDVAKYHDLGKFVTREKNEKTGYHNYIRHEKVSAMYFLDKSDITEDNLRILEVIYLHIEAYNVDIDRLVNRSKLDDTEKMLLSVFSDIDNVSRVV